MNLATVIDLSAAAFGLFSGVFFCIGVLHVKDSTLETIAISMWGKGETIARELALQKVDFIFGASLLFLSFLFQVFVKFLPLDLALSVVATSTLCGGVAGLGGPVILLVLLYLPHRFLRDKAIQRIALLAQENKEQK
jgi:hypothetical protein